MKIDFEKVVENLKENDNILIITHASPDGDTVGSGFALSLALKKLGKRSYVINNDIYPEKFGYMTSLQDQKAFDYDYIVSVDVAAPKVMGKKVLEHFGDKIDLAIDHHATHAQFAKQYYVEPDSASNCEIIFKIIKALGVEIDRDIANCLYTGISTDTGCFKYSSVTAQTHIVAAELIKCGAMHSKINEAMFDTKKLSYLLLESQCLKNMQILYDGKVCIFEITREMARETGCDESEYGAIVALSRQIEGVAIGVTFKEKSSGKIDVSVRTNDEFDSSKLCMRFGGGGHARAAGCSFECTLDEAEIQVKSAIEDILRGEI